MCYSIASSFRTSLVSFIAIIYLLNSGIPHYKWLGIVLIGWCCMQFAELLLWMTNPKKCNVWNKIITMTLIPLALLLQPLGSLFGSLYVIPWNKSSDFRKNFIIFYSIFISCIIYFWHFYNPLTFCSIITPLGQLYWNTYKYTNKNFDILSYIFYSGWALLILLPLLLFWNKSYSIIALICILPLFGFIYGLYRDSAASIWCNYTSYTSIICIILLFLHQTNIYRIL